MPEEATARNLADLEKRVKQLELAFEPVGEFIQSLSGGVLDQMVKVQVEATVADVAANVAVIKGAMEGIGRDVARIKEAVKMAPDVIEKADAPLSPKRI